MPKKKIEAIPPKVADNVFSLSDNPRFTPTRGTRRIILPKEAAPAKDTIIYDVAGNSMVASGIMDGDALICTTKFTQEEILPNRICVVLIDGTDIKTRHVHFMPFGKIALLSYSPKPIAKIYPKGSVEILALVKGAYRDLSANFAA